jgi:hypothetical protein
MGKALWHLQTFKLMPKIMIEVMQMKGKIATIEVECVEALVEGGTLSPT